MALSRIISWVSGQVLTAAALNNEFNNILGNPITLFSPTTGDINMNSNQITNLVMEKLGSDPSAGTAGRLFYNTASAQVKFDSGTAITALAQIGGTSTAVGSASGSYVRGLSGILSTNLGVFSANQYLLQTTNATAAFLLQSTASFTVDTRTAGPIANGRDQAAAFASTDVHWYGISTGTGSTTPAGLVSSNPPSVGPVNLPTSYVAWAYLGASKYDTASSGVLLPHYMAGANAYYGIPQLVNTPSTTETPVSVSTFIPLESRKATLTIFQQLNLTAGSGTGNLQIRLVSGSASIFHLGQTYSDGGGTLIRYPKYEIDLPILSSTAAFTSIRTSDENDLIYVKGYVNSNGDA